MSPPGAWQQEPERLSLGPREVHVWRLSLDAPPARVEAAEAMIDDAERRRADRFLVPAKRSEYVLTRALLRRIAGRILGAAPRQVEIRYGDRGKPYVPASVAGAALELNASHSDGISLVAAALGRAVGVDVERRRDGIELEALARRFFSPREAAQLLALPAAEQIPAFYACWTRKEALLKATGQGIALGLDQFDVAFAPGEAPRVVSTAWDPAEAARWGLAELDVGPHHAAALCVSGGTFSTHRWEGAA